jgi:hypothetical protein
VPVTHLPAEVRELSYPGSANLLVGYLKTKTAPTPSAHHPHHADSSPGSSAAPTTSPTTTAVTWTTCTSSSRACAKTLQPSSPV